MTEQPETRIAKPRPERPHGAATRGLGLAPKSSLFEGRFGRIFRALPAADYGANDTDAEALLIALGAAMVAEPDATKDGPDGEESGIPALYTYFGQFIDHDLTFDPASSLQRQNDPDALTDFRTPAFDLDCVYGRGIDDQPYMYEEDGRFALGTPLTGDALGTAIAESTDLPRSVGRGRAIIGDPRNDENSIVSQFQGLLHRFHNRLIGDGASFNEAQRLTRWHYQWVVINDFLPKIVHATVLHKILPHYQAGTSVIDHPPQLRFFHPHECPFMPLEFAAAAYRFGHSMIRPGYRLNDATLQPIFQYPGSEVGGPGLQGFGLMIPSWAIDWSRFVDLDVRPFGSEDDPADPNNAKRLQLAYRIDSSLTTPLGSLPDRVVAPVDPIKSLAQRNLIRGWRMRLPSGQAVARAIGKHPMTDDQIKIGKADGDPVPALFTIPGLESFEGNCPLWTYILAEAAFGELPRVKLRVRVEGRHEAIETPQLGWVGGTIVAETFVGILLGDKNSFWSIDPLWRPNAGGHYGLRDFVAFALRR